VDGLLDTGADRTIFPGREAQVVGIQLPTHADGSIKSATGVAVGYRLAEVVLEIRSAQQPVRWKTPVAFAEAPLQLIHLGTRGFLQTFTAHWADLLRPFGADNTAS
jgi:hypothetical protein